MAKNRKARLEQRIKKRKVILATASLLGIEFYLNGKCPHSEATPHNESSLRLFLYPSNTFFIPCLNHVGNYSHYKEIKEEEDMLPYVGG